MLLALPSNFCLKGASHRAHFELAVYLWQEWAGTGEPAPSAEYQTEIVLCLERCLQLQPSNVDALKALALFHLQIRQDRRAAAPLLEKLAEVFNANVASICRCALS